MDLQEVRSWVRLIRFKIVMNTLTVHTTCLSSGEQSYLREYTWCVLGGTGHKLLYIN